VSLVALKVLIVDDEDLARLRLRGLVHECMEPKASVVGEAASTAQALAWLAANRCDVLLLDVQMPGPSGMQLALQLRAQPNPPAVVFVTAHSEHALRAFELDAVDYLTKPVRRERLHAALLRVAQRLTMNRSQTFAPPTALEDAAVIIVTDRGRVLRVPVVEVLYFKAELKYVTLRTAEHTFVLDETLSELEARLGDRFLRVHRNALVACTAVCALERRVIAGEEEGGGGPAESWAVCMAPLNEWLAVSRRQVAAVREALVRTQH
jgi:two-component system, LytTR family, response regulator AlgR